MPFSLHHCLVRKGTDLALVGRCPSLIAFSLSRMIKNRLAHGHRLGVRGSALRRLRVVACANRSALLALFLFGSALFSVHAMDSNSDGLSDVWQRLYGVADGSASEDGDRDGFTNLQESLLGTDPDDASSAIHLQIFPQSGNSLRLRMETVVGKLYQIESSEDLVHWIALGDLITGTGDSIEVESYAPASSSVIFYRGRFAGDIARRMGTELARRRDCIQY